MWLSRHRAKVLILGALIALAGCDWPSREDALLCNEARAYTEEEREACAAEDERVAELAFAGTGDPVAEARRALAAEDYRLFGHSLLVPGSFPIPYGLECRPVAVPVRSVSYASDVIMTADEMAELGRNLGNHARFGGIYNATLMSAPSNPMLDICRTAPEGFQPTLEDWHRREPHEFGFRDLPPTEEPVDLHQAARRGTLQSLARLIEARSGEINKGDLLTMTPLAWAVAYQRPEHAHALLRAGASPLGPQGMVATFEGSPVQIARTLRWRAMIDAMLPHIEPRFRDELIDKPKFQYRQSSGNSLTQAMEKYRSNLSPGKTRHEALVTVAPSGRPTRCRIEPTSGDPDLDGDYCRIITARTTWTPARDLYGEPTDGEGAVPLIQDVPMTR